MRRLIEALRRAASSVLLGLLWFYKHAISPYLPSACRFEPTCSVYAGDAIRTHGPLKGAALAAWRLARCQPFSRGGYDPVPPPKHACKDAH